MCSKDKVQRLQRVCERLPVNIFSGEYLDHIMADSTRLLGSGGQGQCWLIEDGMDWVVKTVKENKVKALIHEIKALVDLQTVPGVQKIIAVCPERLSIVTDFAGKDLLDFKESLNLDEKLAVVRQVSKTLFNIHRLGWCHVDIKEPNVCVTRNEDGFLKVTVIDFGIAVRHGGTHTFKGSCQYMAPEVLQSLPIHPKADSFSLGVLIQRLFRDGLPAAVFSWVYHAKARDPEERMAVEWLYNILTSIIYPAAE